MDTIEKRENLAAWVIEQRNRQNLSQAELARRARVDQTVINRIERRKVDADIPTLKALAKYFGVDVRILYYLVDILKPEPKRTPFIDNVEFMMSDMPEAEQREAENHVRVIRERFSKEREVKRDEKKKRGIASSSG